MKKFIKHPWIAEWFLNSCLRKEDRIHQLGDFEEVFHTIFVSEGRFAAWRWYWQQVVRSVPELAMNSFYWSAAMLKNYIKIAIRNLFKHKGYSFINIAGLALGAACCLLITRYVIDEHSFDRFHEKADRIYRVHYSFRRGENLPPPAPQEFRAWGNALVGPQLEAEFPEVLRAVRFSGQHTILIARGERSFQHLAILIASYSPNLRRSGTLATRIPWDNRYC